MKLHKMHFGNLPSGEEVFIYTLQNDEMCVQILNYGGIIQSIKTNDKNGQIGDVVLGYDDLDGYVDNPNYFGGIIGRCCNDAFQEGFSLLCWIF